MQDVADSSGIWILKAIYFVLFAEWHKDNQIKGAELDGAYRIHGGGRYSVL